MSHSPRPDRPAAPAPRDIAAAPLTAALPDEAATAALGTRLAAAIVAHGAQVAASGAVITLSGELGAGKTALVRALLRALGVTGPVRSPTFTLLEPYAISRLNFYHVDLYRMGSAHEFSDAGFRELFGPGRVVLIEWPERAPGVLPAADLAIGLAYPADTTVTAEDARSVTLQAHSHQGQAWLTHLGELARAVPEHPAPSDDA